MSDLPSKIEVIDIPLPVLKGVVELSKILVDSGMLPAAIKTWQAATAVILKGREVRIPAMQAFTHINIIQGKPCISAELMMALIYRDIPGAKVEFERYEVDGCTLLATRPGHKPARFTFNRVDAEAAGLLGKDNWKKYPRAMYRSRAISEMARSVFPDALMGCSYTPEEINPDVAIDVEGQVTDIPIAELPEAHPRSEVYSGTPEQKPVLLRLFQETNSDESLWVTAAGHMKGEILNAESVKRAIDKASKG